MNKEMNTCPYCNNCPELRKVGDRKQYFVYFCSQCNETPVKYSEVSLNEPAARKVWNKSSKGGTIMKGEE